MDSGRVLTHTDAHIEGHGCHGVQNSTDACVTAWTSVRDRAVPHLSTRLRAAADAGGGCPSSARRMTVGTLGRNGPLPCIIRRSRSSIRVTALPHRKH